jgi:predicted nucleic acid-binding protein
MSGSRIAIDTNIVLYLLNGDQTLAEFLQDKKVYLSVITELEIIGYQGLSKDEKKSINRFFESCTIIDINKEIKSTYIELRNKYKLKLGDAIIAATALCLDLPFISADKDFSKIKELQLTQYIPE